MTSGYSDMSYEGNCRSRCLKFCCVLFGILALIILCVGSGILGAFAYDHYISKLGNNNNKNSNSNSNSNSNHHHSGGGGGETLVFEENFDTLDLSIWKHVLTASGGGNWEFEYYTNNRSNSYVRDGILYIKPTLTNNTYTAADFITTGT